MNYRKFLVRLTAGLIIMIYLSCEKVTSPLLSGPPSLPVEQLLAAPDTLQIEGRTLTLSADLWRDFMPVSPPDGRPLVAIVTVEAVNDTNQLPDAIGLTALYVVDGKEIWRTYLSDEEPSGDLKKPNRIVKIAWDGPKWPTDIYVDVIVTVSAGGETYLLRAPDQYIQRTD